MKPPVAVAKETSVCVVDAAGKVILEQKVLTEPADIIALLTSLGVSYGRIGIEAGGHIKFFSIRTLRQLLKEAGAPDPMFLRIGRTPVLAKSMVAIVQISD